MTTIKQTAISIIEFMYGLIGVTLTIIFAPWAVTTKGDIPDGRNKEG